MATYGAGSILEVVSKGLQRCGVKVCDEEMTLHADPAWIDAIQVGDVLTLHNPTMRLQETEMHIYVSQQSGGHIFIQAGRHRGNIQTAELFAGLGGWNRACEVFNEEVTIFVEKDRKTAEACARQHKCGIFTPEVYVEMALKNQMPQQAVLHGDINEPIVWTALCLANVGKILASPPCQPWCSRGNFTGLSSPEGQLMTALGRWCGKTRMLVLIIENVAGLPKHPDFAPAMRYIEDCDMHMYIHGVHQIHKIMPVHRARWLATFVHKRLSMDPQRVALAQSISFSDRAFAEVSVSPSLSDADVMHVNMSPDERNRLVIPDDALQMLADSKLAPEWIRVAASSLAPDHILQARIVETDAPLAGIMASYGSQHRLPPNLLLEKGLLTPLANDQGGIRFFSPWEFASALGYDAHTVLSSDLEEAWRMSGNGISVAHGWLQLHKTHILMHGLSPFHPNKSPCDQVRQFQQEAIKMSQFETVIDGSFWKLQRVQTEPISKKAKVDSDISPTIPMHVQCEDVMTREWHQQPEFHWIDDRRCIAVAGTEYGSGVVTLVHEQKHWMMKINVDYPVAVSSIVAKGLPHADEHHFAFLWAEGKQLQWTDVISVVNPTIVFAPNVFAMTCKEESLNAAIHAMVDTTWTVQTLAAYCAVNMGCMPDVITLHSGPNMAKDQDYLMAYDTEEWTIKFKPKTPRYVEWAPVAVSVADETVAPVQNQQCRWVARHPTKKVIRTVVADERTSLKQLVQQLFPDLHANTPWRVHHDMHEVDHSFAANIWDKIQLQWEGFRPFQITVLSKLPHDQSMDAPTVQAFMGAECTKLMVRSPFNAKTMQLKLKGDMLIQEVAAHFLAATQVNSSMICFNGAAIVDPNLPVKDCDCHGTYSFRIYPMLGGVKHEPVRNRLKELFANKGVPEDKIMDRLNAFASKVGVDKLNAEMANDDDSFWSKTKSLASDARQRKG
eukprot:Skav206793  [mRNA]  locus=scaffold1990:81932:84852:+ [translate_table: standard]